MTKSSIFTGNYAKAFFSDTIPVSGSIEENYFKKIFELKENEALSIYSFQESRMVFAQGYENLFDLDKKDVNLAKLNEIYDEPFNTFKNEYHDRALLYIYNNNKNLDSFSSSFIFTNKVCKHPLFINVQVFQADANGNLVSTVGKITESPEIKTSDVVQYSFNGDFDSSFLFQMNHQLDFKNCISEKSIQILECLMQNFSPDNIAKTIGYSIDQTIEAIKIIKNRFNLDTETEIKTFVEDNYLLPNQFLTTK